MKETIQFVIQTNKDIDKCGVFDVDWHDAYDVPSYPTLEDAQTRVQDGVKIRYSGICSPWSTTLKREDLRIVKRITLEEIIK